MSKEEIKIWEIDLDKYEAHQIDKLNQFELEKELENILAKDISILGDNLKLIGRQLYFNNRDHLDLLCLDDRGNTIIIELKKDKGRREAIGQSIDYAAKIADMNWEEFKEFINKGERNSSGYPQFDNFEDLCKELSDNPEEEVNQSQKILLVILDLDEDAEKMISWLSDYGVEINAVEFQLHKLNNKYLLARRVILTAEIKEKGRQLAKEKQRTKTPDLSVRIRTAVENGLIKIGTKFFYDGRLLVAPEVQQIKKDNPKLFEVEITGIPNKNKIIKWLYDKNCYSLGGLTDTLKMFLIEKCNYNIGWNPYSWVAEDGKLIGEILIEKEGNP
ncbi:MAG: endonuclease NucS domain-containing protein [Nitrospirota bacterium]